MVSSHASYQKASVIYRMSWGIQTGKFVLQISLETGLLWKLRCVSTSEERWNVREFFWNFIHFFSKFYCNPELIPFTVSFCTKKEEVTECTEIILSSTGSYRSPTGRSNFSVYRQFLLWADPFLCIHHYTSKGTLENVSSENGFPFSPGSVIK